MTPAALEWIAGFRRHLAIERRLSAHTDSNYARDLAALVKYCDRHGLKNWAALDAQHVRTFALLHERQPSSFLHQQHEVLEH